MKKYKIKEVFGPTIQGEGSYVGTPCLFVRFSGCNKWSGRKEDKAKSICSFCDTDFLGGDQLDTDEIIAQLSALSITVKTVVISGGEPTLQMDHAFCHALYKAGFKLHLETNGSRPLEHLAAYFEHITCSPKQSFIDTKLEFAHDLKLLYPFIENITHEQFLSFKAKQTYLQPVWSDDYTTHLFKAVNYIYKYPNLKLSLQTHKITGVK